MLLARKVSWTGSTHVFGVCRRLSQATFVCPGEKTAFARVP